MKIILSFFVLLGLLSCSQIKNDELVTEEAFFLQKNELTYIYISDNKLSNSIPKKDSNVNLRINGHYFKFEDKFSKDSTITVFRCADCKDFNYNESNRNFLENNGINYILKFNKVTDLNMEKEDYFLFPKIIQDSAEVNFKLTVIKLKERRIEYYFPDSEELRIIITGNKNNVKWNSSEGKNYLQVISKFEPADLFDIHTYSLNWDTKLNDASQLIEGNYNVVFQLNSKPNNFIKILNFKRQKK